MAVGRVERMAWAIISARCMPTSVSACPPLGCAPARSRIRSETPLKRPPVAKFLDWLYSVGSVSAAEHVVKPLQTYEWDPGCPPDISASRDGRLVLPGAPACPSSPRSCQDRDLEVACAGGYVEEENSGTRGWDEGHQLRLDPVFLLSGGIPSAGPRAGSRPRWPEAPRRLVVGRCAPPFLGSSMDRTTRDLRCSLSVRSPRAQAPPWRGDAPPGGKGFLLPGKPRAGRSTTKSTRQLHATIWPDPTSRMPTSPRRPSLRAGPETGHAARSSGQKSGLCRC